VNDHAETILTGLCTALLQHLGLPGHIEITEHQVPRLCLESSVPPNPNAPEPEMREMCHVAVSGLDLPTIGYTRVESLGWTLAQALARVEPTSPIAIATHDALAAHGIVIPTREEYDRKLAEHAQLDLCSFSPPTVH